MNNLIPRRPAVDWATLVAILAMVVLSVPWWIGLYVIYRWMTT